MFDVRRSLKSEERQNYLNVRLFDVQHSKDEGQNDLNAKLFDVRHWNDECKNDLN